MASRFFVTGFFLLLLLALCQARPMSFRKSNHATVITEESAAPARELLAGTSCTAWDIKVNQGQASAVGLPTWDVQIVNTCIDPRCSISNVIVQCGHFHSASLVNPAVFRRLDPTQGTCIVKNGNAIGNGELIDFQYQEDFEEPLTLKAAKVSCSG